LEVNPRNLCVTGTFTLNASCLGCPKPNASMVMAETQKSPESVRSAKRLRAQRIRQDSAACVSLSSNHLSKSIRRSATPMRGSAFAAPSRRKRSHHLDRPGKPRIKPEIAAHWSPATYSDARERVNNLIPSLVSTPNERFSALALAWGIFAAPQIGPLCSAQAYEGNYHAFQVYAPALQKASAVVVSAVV